MASGMHSSIQFNSIQAFIDAAYMHGQRCLTISSKSKSALILVSVRTINLVEKRKKKKKKKKEKKRKKKKKKSSVKYCDVLLCRHL